MTMTQQSAIPVLELHTRADAALVLGELLAGMDADHAVWRDPDADRATIRIYCLDREEENQLRTRLEHELQAWSDLIPGPPPKLQSTQLQAEDWTENWKKYFKPLQVTDRLVVKPSWEQYTPHKGEIVLELDPGMSFGTGYHGTTRACLEMMDALSDKIPGLPLLDAGCGSGILSVAAWKLGFRPVTAFDHDPQAVQVARKHVASLDDGPSDGIEVIRCKLEEFSPKTGYRVVVANILAAVLERHAERLVSFLDQNADTAYLILSGILTSQFADIKQRFEALGVRESERRTIDEWTTGCFERKPDADRLA